MIEGSGGGNGEMLGGHSPMVIVMPIIGIVNFMHSGFSAGTGKIIFVG